MSPPARRRLAGGLLAAAVLLGGCGLGRPVPLDVLPGHRAVLGRIEIGGLDAADVVVELSREDGTYRVDLPVPAGGADFALSMPPGDFRIPRLRLVQDRRTMADAPIRYLRVSFSVGREPATYIGTLRIRGRFDERVEVEVRDDYARTVPALRARYADVPERVERALMQVGS